MVLSERGFLTLKLRGADKHRVGYSRLIGYRMCQVTAVVIEFFLLISYWWGTALFHHGNWLFFWWFFLHAYGNGSQLNHMCASEFLFDCWACFAQFCTLGIAHVRRKASVSSWPSRPGRDRVAWAVTDRGCLHQPIVCHSLIMFIDLRQKHNLMEWGEEGRRGEVGSK